MNHFNRAQKCVDILKSFAKTRRRKMKLKRTLTIATLLTLGAAAYMPVTASAQVGFNLVISNAPPAPRYESIPAPRNGYVWAPGYWNWQGNQHVWVEGRWERDRQGYRYQRAEWIRDNAGYRLNQGGWQIISAGNNYDGPTMAPPELRYERQPRARRGYVWSPGHWQWRNNRFRWVKGSYVRVRAGYTYQQPSWVQRDGRWVMEESRWVNDRDRDGVPDRLEGGRDRDRDGIPDRLEGGRDRDRDGVPDRLEGGADRDRDGVPDRLEGRRDSDDADGDGVRNSRDRYPNDPRRR
jgi:hypothetical protein